MTTDDTEPALDAIQFFANSANRVDVFRLLAEGPTTGSTLARHTEASRSTVARILDEGRSRGWIDSEGSRYGLTSTGEHMIEEFRAYLRTVEAIQELGGAIEHLPDPARELDVRHLRDARVTIPTTEWPNARLNRALELYESGETYRGLTQIAPHVIVRTLADLVERGRLEVEGVIETEFVEEALDDPERAAPWRTLADGVWVYEGRVPLNMHIIDETVVLWLASVDGDEWERYGLLESEHPAVMRWAESLYRDYRTEAEPLDRAVLPGV
jgi:predicted transcriptional regulator